LNISVSSVKTY